MIIIKSSSGLGNQIFQYAIGLSLSENLNTKCLFDVSHYKRNNHRNFRLQYFNIKLNYISIWKTNFYHSEIVKLFDKIFSTNNYHHLIIDPIWEKVNFDEGKNYILRGYWPHNDYFELYKSRIINEIVVKSQFSTLNHQKLLLEIQQKESVSIHIRRGDYNNKEISKLFGLLPKEYYKNAINLVLARVIKPLFFIFSDDIKWVKDNINLPKSSIFVSQIIEGVDYLEFDLMRSCKHNIIANSTFSWWAAFLNIHTNKIVIQPKKWYNAEYAQEVYDSQKILFIKGSIRL